MQASVCLLLLPVLRVITCALVAQPNCPGSNSSVCYPTLEDYLVSKQLDFLVTHKRFLEYVDRPSDLEYMEQKDISALGLEKAQEQKLGDLVALMKAERDRLRKEAEAAAAEAERERKRKLGWQWSDYEHQCEACRLVVEQTLGRVADVLHEA